jgi:hypothetical protein
MNRDKFVMRPVVRVRLIGVRYLFKVLTGFALSLVIASESAYSCVKTLRILGILLVGNSRI